MKRDNIKNLIFKTDYKKFYVLVSSTVVSSGLVCNLASKVSSEIEKSSSFKIFIFIGYHSLFKAGESCFKFIFTLDCADIILAVHRDPTLSNTGSVGVNLLKIKIELTNR